MPTSLKRKKQLTVARNRKFKSRTIGSVIDVMRYVLATLVSKDFDNSARKLPPHCPRGFYVAPTIFLIVILEILPEVSRYRFPFVNVKILTD